MTTSGASLFALAQQFGLASTLLSVEGSLRGLQEIEQELHGLQASGVISLSQYNGFRNLLDEGRTSEFPPHEDIDPSAEVEAQILGRLVRERLLPKEESERLRALLSGTSEIDVPSLLTAHRRIRAPWVVSFLREAGFQPYGSPHHVRRTRLERFAALEDLLQRPVYLKREDDQPVGSFKNRGATNFLVTALLAGFDPETMTVGTASHGNHAQGVVQAAHNLGIRKVEVLLPQNASPLKIAQLKLLGAQVELFGETFEECADEVARRAQVSPDYLFLPAFDQPLVVMGQGTAAVELSLQMVLQGHHDYTVLVPAGGGGLIAGMATYLKREGASADVQVVGLESKAHPYISRSYQLNRVVEPEEIKHFDTVADGIALLKIGRAGFWNILRYVRGVEVVPERLIEATLAFLQERGMTLEGAAATPIASLLFGGLSFEKYGLPEARPVVVVASGRNIDGALLARQVAEHGEGRWRQLKDHLDGLRRKLKSAGYLQDGSVRPLSTPEDGIAFVDFLMANLPSGWDLIDAFELLDFGGWKEKKDINGSLRSFGQYHQRWNHSKEESLTHPESNRGQQLENVLYLLETGTPMEEALKHFPLVNVHRLQVETHVMDLFLSRPDWLERLRPSMTEAQRALHFEQFKLRNEMLRAALGKFFSRIG